MIVKNICTMFGISFTKKALAKAAMIEIMILAVLYFALIILRFTTTMLSHELFMELMLLLGVGLVFDHYSVTVLSMGGCDTCQRDKM